MIYLFWLYYRFELIVASCERRNESIFKSHFEYNTARQQLENKTKKAIEMVAFL